MLLPIHIYFYPYLVSINSEYVRKSIGNALRDISKKYPQMVSEELKSWDLSSNEIKQVYKLAGKFLEIDER